MTEEANITFSFTKDVQSLILETGKTQEIFVMMKHLATTLEEIIGYL